MFDLSGVSEELLPYTGILQSVLGIIDTNTTGMENCLTRSMCIQEGSELLWNYIRT